MPTAFLSRVALLSVILLSAVLLIVIMGSVLAPFMIMKTVYTRFAVLTVDFLPIRVFLSFCSFFTFRFRIENDFVE